VHRSAAWFGAHVASWALLASFLLHLQSTTSDLPAAIYALISNVYGVFTPIVYFSVLIPIAVIGGNNYKEATNGLTEIRAMLESSESSWNEGDTFSILTLAPALPLFNKLEANVGQVVVFFRAAFVFYSITAILLVIVRISFRSLFLLY
jgi:hypothetical protein